MYPSGVVDEFFYTADSAQLLVEVGNDDPLWPTLHPTEEYVWLGGQVVAIIRGKLDKGYQRLADEGTDCQRNGDWQFGTGCGVYYPVMDVTGRPVAMLDGALKVAGVGESDPFGHVNRVQVLASTDHAPYSDYYHLANGPMLRDFGIDEWAPGSTEVRFKLHFYGVDTEPYNDVATLWDVDTKQPLAQATERCVGLPECGYHLGETTTYWVQPSSNGYGKVELEFVSSGQNYAPPGQSGTGWPYWGVALDRVDYRRNEVGAQAWWPAQRLPGQYHDEETDLFENWNRFYDATTGRYLSPEPYLQRPGFVRAMAKRGVQLPTYAYAANDPLSYVDQNGLQPAPRITPPSAPPAWVPLVIQGGAGAPSAAAVVAGGVIIVGGVVVGTAAVAATVYVGSGQFTEPGAGTAGGPSAAPAPVPHAPGEPGVPNICGPDSQIITCMELEEEPPFGNNYGYSDPRAAMCEFPGGTMRKPKPTVTGPCIEVGSHYNVVTNKGMRMGSIVCCPCCEGPSYEMRCGTQ